jgi:hypothetical protein
VRVLLLLAPQARSFLACSWRLPLPPLPPPTPR